MDEKVIVEQTEKIKKDTEELMQRENINSLIKNNIVEFKFKDILYRVKKPSFEQKYQVNKVRMSKYIEMLKDKNNLLEEDLIKLYESRGISIKELDIKFNTLNKQREDLAEKLGKALADKKPENELEVFTKEITRIISEQSELIARKTVLLDSSIEAQINVFIYTYLAFIITERFFPEGKEEGKWDRPWNSYQEFLNEEEDLVNTVVWYTATVAKSEIPTM